MMYQTKFPQLINKYATQTTTKKKNESKNHISTELNCMIKISLKKIDNTNKARCYKSFVCL